MQVSRRVNLTPFRTTEPRHGAPNVARSYCDHPAASETVSRFLDIQVRSLQMFNRVPKADGVWRFRVAVIEVISYNCRNKERFARVAHRVVRNVDAGNTVEILTRDVQEESVRAANLEHVSAAFERQMRKNLAEAKPELLLYNLPVGYVVFVFLTSEVVSGIQSF